MKKITVLFVSLTMMMSVFAQNEEYKTTIGVNAGFSLVGSLINATTSVGATNNIALPAIQATFDYGVEKWVSIGAAISYQKMGVEYENYDGTGSIEETNLNRLNLAIRPLFHYANTGKIDLYSGLRLGWTLWSYNTTIDDNTYDPEDLISSVSNFAPQLILFGMRAYVTNNIGANFEFAVGAPHYFTLGLSYRL